MRLQNYLMTTCAMASALAFGGEALAQTTAQTADEGVVQEVVVTANKREQNLQDVAASVTAITSVNLERQGVKEFTDIQRVNPDVRVQGAPSPTSPSAACGLRTSAPPLTSRTRFTSMGSTSRARRR